MSGEAETPRAAIPADIDAPDKIVWGLTFRQLAILAIAGALYYGMYRALGHAVPPVVLPVVGVPLIAVAAVLALGRRDGLSMDAWLAAALQMRRVPRLQTPAGTATPATAGLVATTGTPPVPAQLRLPAEAITDTGLLHLPGATAAVVAAGTVNLGLRTAQEQAALLAGYARWLNSLTAPVQVVVSTQRIDLEPYATALRDAAALLPHPALASAACDYAEFLTDLAQARDPLRRQVLVVVRGEDGDRGGAARRGEDTARALTALGLNAARLDGPAYTAALATAVDPYAPPVPGPRAVPDAVITTTTPWS